MLHSSFCCHPCDGMEYSENALGTQASMTWSVCGGGCWDRWATGTEAPSEGLVWRMPCGSVELNKKPIVLSFSVSSHLSFPPASWDHLPSAWLHRGLCLRLCLGKPTWIFLTENEFSLATPELHSFLISFRNHSVSLGVGVLGWATPLWRILGWLTALVKTFCFVGITANKWPQFFWVLFFLGVWNNTADYFETNKQGRKYINLFTLTLHRRCLVHFQGLVNSQGISIPPYPLVTVIYFLCCCTVLKPCFLPLKWQSIFFNSPRVQQQLNLPLCERAVFV